MIKSIYVCILIIWRSLLCPFIFVYFVTNLVVHFVRITKSLGCAILSKVMGCTFYICFVHKNDGPPIDSKIRHIVRAIRYSFNQKMKAKNEMNYTTPFNLYNTRVVFDALTSHFMSTHTYNICLVWVNIQDEKQIVCLTSGIPKLHLHDLIVYSSLETPHSFQGIALWVVQNREKQVQYSIS